MYMVIANIFQTVQTFILSREPLPENLQKIVDAEEKKSESGERKTLPFEPGSTKKESDNKRASKASSSSSGNDGKSSNANKSKSSKSSRASKTSKASSSKASKKS